MFIVVGTNHKICPIELREKLYFSKKSLNTAFTFLKESKNLEGAVILSTCNRVEIYASTKEPNLAREEIKDFISRYHEIDSLTFLTINSERGRKIDKQNLSSYLYMYEDKDALRHLFLVASGLDSLILGETQILGQVKFSFREAELANFVDGFLRKAFFCAILVAKKVHKETLLSEGKISIGSVTVDFIKEKLGSLHKKNILIVGVGKVTELLLRYLKKETSCLVFISNRTFEKARELAQKIGASIVRFNQLKEKLKEADVVISATSSPHLVLKKEDILEILSHRLSITDHQLLLIIDLAVPRDVDPGVREIEGVELFDLEDLGVTIQRNLERRKIEAEKANSIINQEVERIWKRLTELVPEEVHLL